VDLFLLLMEMMTLIVYESALFLEKGISFLAAGTTKG